MRLALSLTALAALAAAASAQPEFGPPPALMPGVTVGTMPAGAGVKPVGIPIPKAAPRAGTPVAGGTLPGTVPPIGPGANGQPVPPNGKLIDLSNVVAPYPNMPKELTFWEKLEARYFYWLNPPEPVMAPPNWTPGLGRRNRERREARLRPWWTE